VDWWLRAVAPPLIGNVDQQTVLRRSTENLMRSPSEE